MKRFHVNITVKDLSESVSFYRHLFDTAPTVEKDDYAKWILDDPRINFSLTTVGVKSGINHIGMQVENESDFVKLRERLIGLQRPTLDQPEVTCCYANSTKTWIEDPDGVSWETFMTASASDVYGDGENGSEVLPNAAPSPCCAPGDTHS